MKTSFLKGFFNSKDNSKSNYSIHNVDLDDSDDAVLSHENFFQKNNSPKEHDIKSNKSDDIFHKKFNIYSLNESISSINSDIKSPISNEFNFSKNKNLYSHNEHENMSKTKNCLQFTAPSPLSLLKTPTKEIKLNQLDTNYKNCLIKGLGSPTILSKGFINRNHEQIQCLKDNKIKKSPVPWRLQFSPKKVSGNSIVNNQFENNIKNDLIDINEDLNDKNNNFEKFNETTNHHNYEEANDISKYTNETFEEIKNALVENSTDYNDLSFCEIPKESENSQIKVLHIKLKIEAEKIQKWKENLEKQLSSKNQKLKESEKIIESLRASNLDFQMQQENISLNYQMELDCRSEVSKKIENSRNLCQILKQKIENIEKINQNHIKESTNLKTIQNKTLTITDNILEDIKCYSEMQLIFADNISQKVFSKNEEIKILNDSISDLQKRHESEITNFNNELESNRNELIITKQKLDVLIEENITKENALIEQKNKSLQLQKEIENRLDDILKLEISIKLGEENNYNLRSDIEIKNREVTNLKEMLTLMEESHLKVKESMSLEIESINVKFKTNIELNENLKAINLKNSEEIESLNLMIENLKEEFCSKMQIKDNSIGNLTNSIIEKENNISNLENLIKSKNERLNDLESEITKLKLENETISKNNLILKSSNTDLREETESQILEINKLSNNLTENKIQIENLNDIIKNLDSQNGNLKDSIQKLIEENQTINNEYSTIQKNLIEIQNKNEELEISIINSNAQENNIVREQNSNIKDLQEKLIILQNENDEMKLRIEYVEKEKENSRNFLSSLSDENNVLSKTVEEFKALLVSQDKDLQIAISQKNELVKNQKIAEDKIKNFEKHTFEFENIVSENKFKITSLETFVDDLSKEKHNILKSREDLRKELMFTLEQCKNEHEIVEKKKNKEIENLKNLVNSLTLDSQNVTNKSKNKLSEITSKLNNQKEEIEKLKSDLQKARVEKDQTKKLLDKANLSINDLSEKLVSVENVVEELENSKINLKAQAAKGDNKVAIMAKEIAEKDSIISKLSVIEMDYTNLKSKLLSNSPPVCTQIPEYIQLASLATPKSQKLSTKLENFNELTNICSNTSQKTSKGILRQPGSASKRRKVLFDENDLVQTKLDISDNDSVHSDGVDIDLENIDCVNKESISIIDNYKHNIIVATTPKKPSLVCKLNLTDSKNNGRLTNVRKTPSKVSSKLSDKRKKDKENWFDSDNFFGFGLEA
uniref:Transverse filament protein SYCP-1 n=1 Tax=Schmidtea mediterranea TaxID=79327 RepID=A0A0A0V1J1_SCHMD|nr:transverse filament protein SYCP-1 [Schmidtea mediterranea]